MVEDWVDLAEEMMSDATTLVKWDFVGGDVEAIVDLHFVGVDNLSVESSGQVDGKLGFSCPSSPHDNNNLVLLLVIVIVIMIMIMTTVTTIFCVTTNPTRFGPRAFFFLCLNFFFFYVFFWITLSTYHAVMSVSVS